MFERRRLDDDVDGLSARQAVHRPTDQAAVHQFVDQTSFKDTQIEREIYNASDDDIWWQLDDDDGCGGGGGVIRVR